MTGSATHEWPDCITGVTFLPSHRPTSALGTALRSHLSKTTCLFPDCSIGYSTLCSRGQATAFERSVTAKLLRTKVHNLIRQRSFYAATIQWTWKLELDIENHRPFYRKTCIRQFRLWNHAGSHLLWIYKLASHGHLYMDKWTCI